MWCPQILSDNDDVGYEDDDGLQCDAAKVPRDNIALSTSLRVASNC